MSSRGVESSGPDNSCNDSDAPFWICVLYCAVVHDRTLALANSLEHLRKEGNCNKDLSYMAPLQFMDEGLRLNHGSPQCIWEPLNATLLSRHGDWWRATWSYSNEQSASVMGDIHNYGSQHVNNDDNLCVERQAQHARPRNALSGKLRKSPETKEHYCATAMKRNWLEYTESTKYQLQSMHLDRNI